MINNRKEMNEFLGYECKKYGLKNRHYPINKIKESSCLYKYNYLLRHLEYYSNCNKIIRKYIFKLWLIKYQRKLNIYIPINVFDKGLKMIHIGYRLVNGKAKVGENCTLHVNTYIVAGGTNDFAPVIGNNVIIGVGCTVLGNAKVGDNVAIGANAVVNKDFSEGNMTIAGVPAKKISDKTKENWKKENRI